MGGLKDLTPASGFIKQCAISAQDTRNSFCMHLRLKHPTNFQCFRGSRQMHIIYSTSWSYTWKEQYAAGDCGSGIIIVKDQKWRSSESTTVRWTFNRRRHSSIISLWNIFCWLHIVRWSNSGLMWKKPNLVLPLIVHFFVTHCWGWWHNFSSLIDLYRTWRILRHFERNRE